MNDIPPMAWQAPATPGALTVSLAQRRFFVELPKVELHCHLLGTVRRATFADLARRHGAPLSTADIDGFYLRGEKPVGVLRVLRALEDHLLLAPGDFERIAYEYLVDAHGSGVRHAEFFWNPTASIRGGRMPYAALQEAILRGAAAARRDCGITSLLIPSIDREATPDEAVEMVEAMLSARDPQVPGIGMDYREVDRPPELFAPAYALAGRAGLRTTAHAGEFGMPWNNVATAIDVLGIDRVDHGYTIVDNPDLVARAKARGLVFTIVPTNSYYLRTLPPEQWAEQHPIRRMLRAGLRLHPNSDDPTLHHVTPADAWQLLYSHFGFTLADLRRAMLDGIDASWADADLKRSWRADWTAWFDRQAAMMLVG